MPARTCRLLQLPAELLTWSATFLTLVELTTLVSTCRRWYTLLTSTPSLWQRVVVDLERYPLFPLARIVAYSGQLPLVLILENVLDNHVEDVDRVLADNLHRVRVLKLCFGVIRLMDAEGVFVENLETLFQDSLPALLTPAPTLEYFEIASDNLTEYTLYLPERYVGVPVDIFAGQAPNLRHVTLDQAFWFDGLEHVAMKQLSSLTCNPDGWDIFETWELCPDVRDMRFCGSWNILVGDEEPTTSDYWRALPSVSWSTRDCSDEQEAEIMQFIGHASSHGVKHVSLCVDKSHGVFLRRMLEIAGPIVSLCLARGGHDLGLQRLEQMSRGVYVDTTARSGQTFTVSDSTYFEELAEAEAVQVHNRAALHLLVTLKQHALLHLESLTCCESMLSYLVSHFCGAELPQLTSLTIWIVPISQRNTSTFGDLLGAAHLSLDQLGLHVPKLSTLRLGCHPRFPAWERGYVVLQWQEEFVFDEVREITAASIAALMT
ncbi:hypothetical protein EXIGLDRAFT_723247, partial [Exidia glandulosa HHB12029]